MQHHLEVLSHVPIRVELAGGRYTIGSDSGCDIALPGDRTVSRVHATIEAVGSSWMIKDLGSRNGTSVCGERVVERVLRHGDEIRVGRTSIIYHAPIEMSRPETEASAVVPALTKRERDVLLALCAPLLRGTTFTRPASVREISEKLFVSETAIRHHLLRLYKKFDIVGGDDRRRVLLANEAIQVGAVSVAELRTTTPKP